MNSEVIIKSIRKINPNANFSIEGTDINTCILNWYDNTTPISKSEIKAMIPVVEAEMAQEKLNKEAKKKEAEAIMEQLGLTKEHLKALGL